MANIVWIEDDMDVIDRTVWRVEAAGHHVSRVRSMKDAWSQIDEVLAADLILLDLITPEGPDNLASEFPGIVFLRQLREQDRRVPPVVVLTWVSRDEVLSHCQELGVADIVQKPVAPSHLKDRLDAILATQPKQ